MFKKEGYEKLETFKIQDFHKIKEAHDAHDEIDEEFKCAEMLCKNTDSVTRSWYYSVHSIAIRRKKHDEELSALSVHEGEVRGKKIGCRMFNTQDYLDEMHEKAREDPDIYKCIEMWIKIQEQSIELLNNNGYGLI